MRTDWNRITRRWLGRLSLSFLAIGFVLGWEGYKRYQALGGAADWWTLLYFLAAALSVVLGFIGVSERHRPL